MGGGNLGKRFRRVKAGKLRRLLALSAATRLDLYVVEGAFAPRDGPDGNFGDCELAYLGSRSRLARETGEKISVCFPAGAGLGGLAVTSVRFSVDACSSGFALG